MFENDWSIDSIENLENKVIIVTGGKSIHRSSCHCSARMQICRKN